MMTLDEFLCSIGAERVIKKREAGVRIATSPFFEGWGFKRQDDSISISDFFDIVVNETQQLSGEELLALLFTVKVVTQRQLSYIMVALKWALYLRNLPYQPVDDHENPTAIQAPDPVGPDVS